MQNIKKDFLEKLGFMLLDAGLESDLINEIVSLNIYVNYDFNNYDDQIILNNKISLILEIIEEDVLDPS